MEKLSQTDMILMHLRKHKRGITTWEAIKEYGCTRLSAQIFLLKKMGYCISKETVYSKNRYGNPVHFARYFLEEEEKLSLFERLRFFM